MQDVTDKRILAGILTQAEGKLRKNPGEYSYSTVVCVCMIMHCTYTVYVCNVPIAVDTPCSYENPVSWLITVVLVEIQTSIFFIPPAHYAGFPLPKVPDLTS